MFPSNRDSAAGGSAKAAEAAGSTEPASAPLLPQETSNLDPPPYSSVMGQESADWKNRSNSFSGPRGTGTADRASPRLDAAKSDYGLQNHGPPYPGGNPTAPQPMGQPYPPAQAPYAPGPGFAVPPYPAAPTGPGFVGQPPYPAGGNQAPYPTGPPAMQIGFTEPVTAQPRPVDAGGRYGRFSTQDPCSMNGQGTQGGLIFPKESGPGDPYVQRSQYVPNQYGQQPQPQPQPQTIYVVQKNTEDRNDDLECCAFCICCLACCSCLSECLQLCASVNS